MSDGDADEQSTGTTEEDLEGTEHAEEGDGTATADGRAVLPDGGESEDADVEGEDADVESEDADVESEDADTEGEDADTEGEESEESDAEGEESEEEEGEEGEERSELEAEFDRRLDEVEADLEDAETEADLDALDERLDEIRTDLEAAEFPDEEAAGGEGGDGEGDEEGDDEAGSPARERIEERVEEVQNAIDGERGPYAEDVAETVEGARSTIEETRWTDDGRETVADATSEFLATAGEHLDGGFVPADDDLESLTAALEEVAAATREADLDPDEDEATIAALLEAAEELRARLEEAEEWDDLTVRDKLAAEGFYDVLTPENRKDFPPELTAVRVYESMNEPEPIVMAFEMLGSEFMEENCRNALKRLGAEEAFEPMHQRAQKRNKPAIEVLGKIGDERAVDTLLEYVDADSDPGLQRVTFRALGEIGSEEATQPLANKLVAEDEEIRSRAARALGLVGDTRAIDPLRDVLADDDSDTVRASAAWALNQIGTESALEAAGEYADDRSYLVQSEAEWAAEARGEAESGGGGETGAAGAGD